MKKAFNIISISVHSLYFLWCIAGIIICVVYHYNYEADFGRDLAFLALDVCMWAFFGMIFVIPFLLGMNISSSILAKSKKERIIWIVVSAVSPFIIAFFGLATEMVLVGTTGGV